MSSATAPLRRGTDAAALAESEARLALATTAARMGIWDWDLETHTFVYSARAREICGFPADGDVTYAMVRAATHLDDFPRTSLQAQRATDPAIRSREPYEYRVVCPDGTVRWVLAHGEAVFVRDGAGERAVRYVGTLQDVTERRQLDEAHVELSQRLKLALDASRLAVWEADIAADTLVASPDLNRLFGLPEDSVPTLATLRRHYCPGEQQRLLDIGQDVLARGERYMEADYRIVRADGAARWLGLRCELLRSEVSDRVRVVGVVSDVTERKAAELRAAIIAELVAVTRDLDEPEAISFAAAEVLGRALAVSRVGYGTIDTVAETITIDRDWSAPGIASLAGTLHFRTYGSYIEDLKRGETVVCADADRDPRTAATAAALKAISAQAFVNMPVTERGGFVALLYLNHELPRDWTDDELTLIREVAEHTRTAVERRRVERALRALAAELEARVEAAVAEKTLLAEIVESTDTLIMVADVDYRLLAVNKAAADAFEGLYGFRPTVGASLLDLLDDFPEQAELVRAAWGRAFSGESYSVTQRFGGHAGRFFDIKFNVLRDRSGHQIGAYQFVYDVTERITREQRLAHAEEALRQAQKTEALGQLTGGVAHDFNNLLTPIIGGLDLLQRRIGTDDRTQRILSGALAAAERAQTLVQRLLAFARRQPLQPTAIDVGQLIEGMRDLIASTTGPTVQLDLQLSPGLPPARADANQLEMALLNLAVNARDAMADGGRLTVRAALARLDDGDVKDLAAGSYIAIEVEDDGVGMDEATLARAIEPFFSTKGVGRGTGLGLSMVYGLVAQLGGAMRLASRPHQGTTVGLILPISETVAEPLKPHVARPAAAARAGTALLVDDEDLVRASTAEMLGELGFDVVQTSSAETALARLDAGLVPDVVITDHLMPGISGVDLVRILRGLYPDLPVLVVSGYAALDDLSADITYLTKPFRLGDLARSLAALTKAAAR